ncbi:MAG: radical SAM protein [Anaerolineales bacterium]|nr:radical SAM protein [Anaerolineales bacterium]
MISASAQVCMQMRLAALPQPPYPIEEIRKTIDKTEYMFYHQNMSAYLERLAALSANMSLEPAEDADCTLLSGDQRLSQRQEKALNVSHALLPNGQRIVLLKTLLTSACERNCYYCPFRAGRDFRRASLQPDEMAKAFMTMYRAGVVQGMFLSSGVAGGSLRTQDQILATAEILRLKMHYKGYLHLKLMPGAEYAQVERAMQLADRVSLNLEAPNCVRLALLAPGKDFIEELLQPLRWADEIRRKQPAHLAWKGRWPSLTTQFVVGAVGDKDVEILATTANLHRQVRLGRAYFSAFHPIADTPFEDRPAVSPLRQLRLYQASFLLRDYGFQFEELPFEADGDLPIQADPKLIWAQRNLSEVPLEINLAERRDLLRLPGIGPKSAEAILRARKKGKLRNAEDLRHIGVNPARALPYILLDGHRPAQQLAFQLGG